MSRTIKPRIIVTGSAEHIGRHLIDAIRQDNEVIGIADCAQTDCGAPIHPQVTWYEADISEPKIVAAAFERILVTGGADVVIFLTAPPLLAEADPDEYLRVNVTGLQLVLDACQDLDLKRFILASSEGTQELPKGRRSEPADELSPEREHRATPQEILADHETRFPTTQLRFSSRPRVIVTGASGFIGRHLLDAIKEDYRVFGFARGSQEASGAPIHPNISWFQVDIADREAIIEAFARIGAAGPVDLIIHLAAYYDFHGEDNPDYWRVNVVGLRNVLDASRQLRPKRFIFASSVGVSDFPRAGTSLNEESPPDGKHTYSITKRIGEEMLAEYEDDFHSTILRIGAMFSDWCEYPPLFFGLSTWLSKLWTRRILGGRGEFAIPYLHVREAGSFFTRVMGLADELEPGIVLLASSDDAVSAHDLFLLGTRLYEGEGVKPIVLPKPICALGLYGRDVLGRIAGRRPFERPWMARYIDRQLRVDTTRTREILRWSPRPRLGLLRRLPIILENYKTKPLEWHQRNHAILNKHRTTTNLRIHRLLEKNEPRILAELATVFTGNGGAGDLSFHSSLNESELEWNYRIALHRLMHTVRSQDMGIYVSFCQDLAVRRFAQGFLPKEVGAALETLGETCARILMEDEEAQGLQQEIEDHISSTTLFGCDQVEEVYERQG